MSYALSILAGYGSFEIKRAYRRNLAIGVLAASAALLIIIGSVVSLSGQAVEPVEPGRPTAVDNPIVLGPPPMLSLPEIPIRVTPPERILPSTGVPVAVPEEDAPIDINVPTTEDLRAYVESQARIGHGDPGDERVDLEDFGELLPAPDSFVDYDEAPLTVIEVLPVYPEVARRAGIEGVVSINVLIGRDGGVRDVRVVMPSGANAGFEEAAIKAAWQTTWKPAISNGEPVAVWVIYKIVFKLK